MSEEQTNCSQCGVTILVLTAQGTGGLCMVCVRGTREQFEADRRAAKEYQARMDAHYRSPEYAFWCGLVERVHAKGIESVPTPEQFHYAVCVLQGEVFSGGFYQYFSNSSGDHYAVAEQALEWLGANSALEILRKAKSLLFGIGPVPSFEARNDRLNALETDPNTDAQLRLLDRALNREDMSLSALVEQHAVKNGLYPVSPN